MFYIIKEIMISEKEFTKSNWEILKSFGLHKK